MRIAVIGEESMVRGFMLAGIKDATTVRDPSEARRVFSEYQRDPRFGVIIVHDKMAIQMEDVLERARRERRGFPMIIVCPGPEGRLPYEDAFTRSVRILAGFGKSQIGGGI